MPPRPANARTAAVQVALDAAVAELGPGPLRVVDVGGGTGGFAVPLARAGHTVTVIDPSPDALANLERRALEADVSELVSPVQGDLESLGRCVEPGSADVVLCHRVLELVADRPAALAALTDTLRPGGLLSLVVANRIAQVLHRAVTGRLVEARELLGPVAGPGPLDRPELEALVAAAGLRIDTLHGARVVVDLVPGALLDDPDQAADLLAFELAATEHPSLRDIATGLHVLARRG